MILSRRWFLLLLVSVVVPRHGDAKTKQPTPAASVEAAAPPALSKRSIADALALFGKLLRVLYNSNGEHDFVLELSPILDKTGVGKELPSDIVQWVREAIAQIGYPLRSYEAVPTPVLVRPIFPGSAPLDRPPHPAPMYRVTGALERVFEREIRGKELEFYLRAGNGSGSTDGNLKHTDRATITRVTVSLTLEQPDGMDLATATYSVDILKTEADRSWGFFVGGTGVGSGRNLMKAEDTGDAIFGAAAAALVTIISRAPQTLAPYYRSSSIFPEDETVNELEHRTLHRMITSELLERIKPLVYLSSPAGSDSSVAGAAKMDMSTPAVTPADREHIMTLMRGQHLDPDIQDSYSQFLYQLWHDIPIAPAADRLEKRIDEVIRIHKEKERQEAEEKRRHDEQVAADAHTREESWSHIGPTQFGWRTSARMVLLDLSKIPDASSRVKIIAAVRTCVGCIEVKTDATGTVLAVRLRPASRRVAIKRQTLNAQASVERAIRGTLLDADLKWVGETPKRLCVSPK